MESADSIKFKLADFGFSLTLREGKTVILGAFVAPVSARPLRLSHDCACMLMESQEVTEHGLPRRMRWSPKCDIYSLGCVIYFMCKGMIDEDEDLFSLKPEELKSRIPRYREELRNRMARCCSREPEKRPDSWEVYDEAQKWTDK